MKKILPFMLLAGLCMQITAQTEQLQCLTAQTEVENNKTVLESRDFGQYNVLFSETFDSTTWHTAQNNGVAVPGNMPAGWSVVDNTGHGFVWRWSSVGPRGRYTSGIGDAALIPNENHRINSTSDLSGNSRGFLMLESDFYNTTEAGQAVSPAVLMDSYIQYGPIDASDVAGLRIRFEQYYRFFGGPASDTKGPKLYTSVNGIDWTRHDVHQTSLSVTSPNASELDMILDAAGAETLYIRFQQIGLSHYFWLIDDLYVYEPLATDIRVNEYFTNVAEIESTVYGEFSSLPFMVPHFAIPLIEKSKATVENFGTQELTNLVFSSNYFKDQVEIASFSSAPIASIAPNETIELQAVENYQIPRESSSVGSYVAEGMVSVSETDLDPFNNKILKSFYVTENLLGYANPEYVNKDDHSPFYFTGSVDGDGLGIIAILNPTSETIPGTTNPAPYSLEGVNVFISNNDYNWIIWNAGDVANLKAEVYAGTLNGEEWVFDLSSPILSSNLMPVGSTYAKTWIHIPFVQEDGNQNIIPEVEGQQYFVLLRMWTNNRRFFIGSDNISIPNYYSNLVVLDNFLGYSSIKRALSLELVINPYNTNPVSNIFFNIHANQNGTPVAAVGAVLSVYSNQANGTQTVSTYTVDNTGTVAVSGLRSGTYSYKVDYYGAIKEGAVTAIGEDQSIEILYSAVGVGNDPFVTNFRMYPNPANNQLTVESGTNVKKMVVSNIVGQVVKVIDNPTERQTIDISQFNAGVYTVTLYNQNQQHMTKLFVKQ
jgi:hypothetical protein